MEETKRTVLLMVVIVVIIFSLLIIALSVEKGQLRTKDTEPKAQPVDSLQQPY